jgi:subtilisin family serine protease
MRFVAPRHSVLFGCAVALALAAGARAAQVEMPASAAYAPSQVVVKLVPDAGSVATRAIGPGFRALTGQAAIQSLDELFPRYGVQRVRRVFRRFESEDGRLVRTTRDSVRSRLARSALTSSAALDAQLAAIPDLENVFVLDLESSVDTREAVAAFSRDENVVWAELNWVYTISAEPLPAVPFVPNDRYVTQNGATWSEGAFGQAFPDLYGLRNTRAIEGWNVLDADGNGSFDAGETRPGEAVAVAVIDTGGDPAHPDLAGQLWVNPGEIPGNQIDDDGNGLVDDVSGWDFVDDDRFPTDPHGHGTHVAGTIAALTNNAVGVAGMAPYARIMRVRGLGANGELATDRRRAWYAPPASCLKLWGCLGISGCSTTFRGKARRVSVAAAGDDADAGTQTSNLDSVAVARRLPRRAAGFSNRRAGRIWHPGSTYSRSMRTGQQRDRRGCFGQRGQRRL